MDSELMKKMGWSQELIDSVNKLKSIIDAGAVKVESSSQVSFSSKKSLDSTTINISNYTPVGQDHVIID